MELIINQSKSYDKDIDLIIKANPNLVKEYHFDPNMGQTLDEHIKEIKIPGIKVEVRKDREGNTMIRKSLENNFEFNLDEAMNFNKEKASNEILSKIQSDLKNMPTHIDETPSKYF